MSRDDPNSRPSRGRYGSTSTGAAVGKYQAWGPRAAGIEQAAKIPKIEDLLDNPGTRDRVALTSYLEQPYTSGLAVHVKNVDWPERDVLLIHGTINKDGKRVGRFVRDITRHADGTLTAENVLLALEPHVQGQGFAKEFYERVENWYIANGVREIKVHADIDVGGYAWARGGFDWDLGASASERSRTLATARHVADAIRNEMIRRGELTPEIEALLGHAATRPLNDPLFPTPSELAAIGRKGKHDPNAPAKAAFHDRHWFGVKALEPDG